MPFPLPWPPIPSPGPRRPAVEHSQYPPRGRHAAAGERIMPCCCLNASADREYGPNLRLFRWVGSRAMRVFYELPTEERPGWYCTCGRRKPASTEGDLP